MYAKTTLFAVATAAILAGCSSGESVPDYHTLLTTSEHGPAQDALAHAKMKCNEAGSMAETATNQWCGVVQKAKTCMGSFSGQSNGLNPITRLQWAAVADVAQVKANPTVACPPK